MRWVRGKISGNNFTLTHSVFPLILNLFVRELLVFFTLISIARAVYLVITLVCPDNVLNRKYAVVEYPVPEDRNLVPAIETSESQTA